MRLRTFTPTEADALVPWLTALFTAVRSDVEALLKGRLGPERSDDELIQQRIVDRLERVAALGIHVRRVDGMVDIPSWRNGELVFLCWRFGEDQVGHWHGYDDGWPERRRLVSDEWMPASCGSAP